MTARLTERALGRASERSHGLEMEWRLGAGGVVWLICRCLPAPAVCEAVILLIRGAR